MNSKMRHEKVGFTLFMTLLFSVFTNGALLPSTSLNLREVNLVRCLTDISHRYFAPGRSLVISSPSTHRDVQQELIAEIHRNSIWPVVVAVDGNISIPEKSDFIGRDDNYIILIPDGNINMLKHEINSLALVRTGLSRIWNSESRFVVAGANELSISQQREIFRFLSQPRIYNCIIVSQEHYVTEEEYSRPINLNDVDTGMKLGVFTWFPYQSNDSCTEVTDITLLDSWVISAQGNFTKNTDLFPRKISNNLNGCPMKAFIRNGMSHFTTDYRVYPNKTLAIAGLEYELLTVVCKQMKMTIALVLSSGTSQMNDGTEKKLIGAMAKKEADIALGGYGTHCLASSYVDSTSIYGMMPIRWYVPCSVKYPRWSSFFRILSVELWLVLIISIVIAAISTTLLGRYSCTSEWQGYKTLSSSFTNVWAVVLGVSVSTMPRGLSLRSLFLAWVCFSLAFNTVFQAFLTTYLIDSGYKSPIQNMDELFASGIKLGYMSQYTFLIERCDETMVSKIKQNGVICGLNGICNDWALYDKNISLLLADNLVEDNYARGEYVGENNEPLLCRLEDGVVFNTFNSMVMYHGDPLLRRVNEIIDRVFEAGLSNFWLSLFTDFHKLQSRKIAINIPLGEYYSFSLYHMQPAFYLLLMGLCLGVLCFMFELLYNRVVSKRM